eukprot:3944141-Ditylum_brightwellii.AAC.1
MTDISDSNSAHGNVHDDIVDDELLINIFEDESSEVDMDEGSDLGDDFTAYSDKCGASGHTILKKKPISTQKAIYSQCWRHHCKEGRNVPTNVKSAE